jgi:RNA polymerase sigma-70 factor (ECF subfamily)
MGEHPPIRDDLPEDSGHYPNPKSELPSEERTEELEQLINACRQYLLMVANSYVDAKLRGKFGASDIVQETLITAHQDVQSFGGSTEDELRLWLKRILIHKIANARRRFVQNAKREIAREVPISEGAPRSDEHTFIDPNPTPRQQLVNNEMHEAVRAAIATLPTRDQELIKLRSFELMSFAEIGAQLEMSSEAARKAWCRAIDRFRAAWRERNS